MDLPSHPFHVIYKVQIPWRNGQSFHWRFRGVLVIYFSTIVINYRESKSHTLYLVPIFIEDRHVLLTYGEWIQAIGVVWDTHERKPWPKLPQTHEDLSNAINLEYLLLANHRKASKYKVDTPFQKAKYHYYLFSYTTFLLLMKYSWPNPLRSISMMTLDAHCLDIPSINHWSIAQSRSFNTISRITVGIAM